MKHIAIIVATAAFCVFGQPGTSHADTYGSCTRDASEEYAHCRYLNYADEACRDIYADSVDICRDTYHKWGRK